MATETVNPYEAQGRERKVAKMAKAILDLVVLEPGTADGIAKMPREWFVNLATAVGVNPPSQDTIDALVAHIRTCEQTGMPEPTTHLDPLADLVGVYGCCCESCEKARGR